MSTDAGTRRPTVSVVIPCYNYGHYLEACVSSVLSQAGVTPRILIIDDASPDGSAAVGKRLAEQHDEVEFVAHAVNRGHIATYNEGLLGWADGEYVTLLSADDELTPGSLGRAVEIMERHPAVGIVYGGSEEFDDDGVTRPFRPGRERVVLHRSDRWMRKRCRELVNVVPTPGTVLRTSVQTSIGGYDAELTHAGDFEMWLRAGLAGDLAFVRGRAQSRYRVHRTSMSAAVYSDELADTRQRKLVFDHLFAERGERLDALAIAKSGVDARFASEALWRACRVIEKSDRPDQDVLSALVEFASSAFPDYEKLRAYRALRRRQRLGAPFCHRTQLFIATWIVKRMLNRLWWRRWHRTGG